MRDDEDQGIAAQRGEPLHGGIEIAHRQRMLLTGRLKHDPINFLERLEPEPALAETGDVEVTENCEHPSLKVGPRLELVNRGDRANHGVLNQVIGAIGLTAEKPRECPQVRKDFDQA